ncbi:dihydrofolate reductase [Melaminivora sp.]|uniref:dihydrofolate reductase n=1 Tax=Melaminivora sp. TaxID=1933032 RepID=UPI0028B03D71|nr:dihydrofolate reductase [Melaminivora sp.]
MDIALIYAVSANGVIGKDGALPWHLPEDLAHFKALTLGQPVIMGRRTWDSLPPRFRPLPGRANLVVTRQPGWQADGAQRAASLQDALGQAARSGAATAWVIGGAQLFDMALPLATRIEATEIAQDFEGDTFMPPPGAEWVEAERSHHVGAQGLPFSFVRYQRRSAQ